MHLCLDPANQVHATEREHDLVGELGRDATQILFPAVDARLVLRYIEHKSPGSSP
jgi:hypothetical protein